MFILPLIMIVRKGGILPSISESWYEVDTRIFTWFTFGVGLPMLLYGMVDGLNEYVELLLVLSGASLIGVGCCPTFKNGGIFNVIHYVCALMAIIFGFTAGMFQAFQWGLWSFIVFAIAAIILKLFKIKNYTWWVEVFAFALIIQQFITVV